MKLIINSHIKLWYTSDSHYAHSNICSATTQWKQPSNTRKFNSLDHMNDTIVNNFNNIVGENDILIHLGDWSFGGFDKIMEFRNRLHCKNIHLILGNHDEHISKNKNDIQNVFSSVNKYLELEVVYERIGNQTIKQNFVLFHYPIASWNNMARGTIHLHGHIHFPPHKRIGVGKMMDVGCDGNGLKPISFMEVYNLMENQPIKSLYENDHHTIVENYIK